MALPEEKSETARPQGTPVQDSASARADRRWGLAIRRWLSPLRALLERMGLLGRVHTGVADRIFGPEFYENTTEHEKRQMDELGRFVFIGVPDGMGGYATKMWIHEDAIEGFLARGFKILSTEETDMPLNDQDLEKISKVISDAIRQNNKERANDPIESVRIRFSWQQLVGAVVVCVLGYIWLDDRFDTMEGKLTNIEQAAERIPVVAGKITSTDIHSSTPPTATDGSPKP